jgi:hypothetical protein
MNKEQVFDELSKLGIVEVKVPFSGGGDEGWVEGVYAEHTQLGELELGDEWHKGKDGDKVTPELRTALAKPVYDKYGSFAGEFYVQADLMWNVPERKVYFTGQEEERNWVDLKEEV